MKLRSLLILSIFGMITFISSNLQAQYLWMEPNEMVGPLLPGDEVEISVYFHAEETDRIYGWAVNLGFDDTAVGGAELTYIPNSLVYGPDQSALATDEAQGYFLGDTLTPGYEGESLFHAGKYDWSFTGYSIGAGEDSLLFTLSFIFDGGTWDGKDDAWFEFDQLNDPRRLTYADADTGLLRDDTLAGNVLNPDFAAVPIPGAIFLLVPAFLGVIGLRRKKT